MERQATTKNSLAPKPYVLGPEHLLEIFGKFFDTPIGRRLGRELYKLIAVDKINEIYRDNLDKRGVDFVHSVLEHRYVGVSYKLHGVEHLDALGQGAFITVSNHAFGALDGLLLIDIIGRRRADYSLLVNNFLSNIETLSDVFIPVSPIKDKKDYTHNPNQNISGLRTIATRIEEGHPIGVFPAGGVARFDFARIQARELPWKTSIVRVIHKAGVPVVPIAFRGTNSLLYHVAGLCSYVLKTLLIPRELFLKRGECIDIYIGAPILPEQIASYYNIGQLRDMLQQTTMDLCSIQNRIQYENTQR